MQKRILDALLATAQNRVELFAVELQEEKCRLVKAMIFGTLGELKKDRACSETNT